MTNGSHLDFLHKYNIYYYIKMNNILTFEDYKKMNIRQVESVIYRQFIKNDIEDEEIVNEGLIRNAINKAAGNFIQTALADEIEKGKELEKSIKEALDGLNKGFDEVEKKLKTEGSDPESSLSRIEKVKEAIKAVQSQAFDTLTMIGSEGEIDFAGFIGSATVAAAVNFGVLFTPIRSLFITRKAYKYFLGIIKQTIRRNLLIIQLNFDQFENLILQKSFESDEDSELNTMNQTLQEIIIKLQKDLCEDGILFKSKSKQKDLSNYLTNFQKTQKSLHDSRKQQEMNNPYRSLWQDQYNNTYTKTLEQIKQYINDDSQKELDALKNSITKMSGNDVELGPFGELLICAAEEYAINTNHGINNNFIKMSSVFNLENQKNLIDLITKTQNENKEEIRKKLEKQEKRQKNKVLRESIKRGKKLYEDNKDDLIDPDNTYTFEEFEDKFEDNIKDLRAYFQTKEGQEDFKEMDEKNPLYKYYIDNDLISTNNFLNSINNLTLIEISNSKDFYEEKKIVEKDQSLYYIMAERSIKDAIKSNVSKEYFGIVGLEDSMIDATKKTLTDLNTIDDILNNTIKANSNAKKYFLTFDGDGDSLFKILHNDFKTEIFDKDGKYVSDISVESKKTLMKLIHKKFKIGNSISTKFAEYLVRLEAHMLLKNKDPWFVPKTNKVLKDCFDIKPKIDKIPNRHAFVEISSDDYDVIKKFLDNYHKLAENDFIIESEDKEKK
jgi:hypothetical protein